VGHSPLGDHQVGSRESALSRESDDSLMDGAMDGRLMDDGVVNGQSKDEDGEETFSCDVSHAFHVSTQILELQGPSEPSILMLRPRRHDIPTFKATVAHLQTET
jgi:hypothetical protein